MGTVRMQVKFSSVLPLLLIYFGSGMILPPPHAQAAEAPETEAIEAPITQISAEDADAQKDAAQSDDDETQERRRPIPEQLRAREYVEDVLIARVSKALELDDEDSILLMRRFKEHREESAAMFRERHQTINAMREALETGDEQASVEGLEKMLELDKRMFEHRQQLILEPGIELDRIQRAQLYVFLLDFEEGMRRVLRQVHMQRDSESRPPGPGPFGNRGRDRGRDRDPDDTSP